MNDSLEQAYALIENEQYQIALEILKPISTKIEEDYEIAQSLIARCHFRIAIDLIYPTEETLKHINKGIETLKSITLIKNRNYREELIWAILEGADSLVYFYPTNNELGLGIDILTNKVIEALTSSKHQKFLAYLTKSKFFVLADKYQSVVDVIDEAMKVSMDAQMEEIATFLAICSKVYACLDNESQALKYLSDSLKFIENWDMNEYSQEFRQLLEAELTYLDKFNPHQNKRKRELFQELINITSDSISKSSYYIEKGLEEMILEMDEEALNSFQTSILLDPVNAISKGAYRYAGRVSHYMGKHEMAAKYYEKPLAIDLIPENDLIEEEMYRGFVFAKVGKFRLSKQSYLKVLESKVATTEQKALAKQRIKEIDKLK